MVSSTWTMSASCIVGWRSCINRSAAVPLPESIQAVFDELPVLELAAASLHGEQAVANLLKVKQTAAALLNRPYLTFSRFIDLMVTRLDEQPEEPESPLAEESSDAVQILTIHKAKGLNFPLSYFPDFIRERAGASVTVGGLRLVDGEPMACQ